MSTTTWSDEAITAKIRDIAKATFDMDLPDSRQPIKDAGLDSLALIDIVMGLEESFGCQLALERLPAIRESLARMEATRKMAAPASRVPVRTSKYSPGVSEPGPKSMR